MKGTEKKIAERAYQKYVHKGGQHGHDLADWLEAEREIKSEQKARTKKPVAKVAKNPAKAAKKVTKKSK